jgi:hypothetical protein
MYHVVPFRNGRGKVWRQGLVWRGRDVPRGEGYFWMKPCDLGLGEMTVVRSDAAALAPAPMVKV